MFDMHLTYAPGISFKSVLCVLSNIHSSTDLLISELGKEYNKSPTPIYFVSEIHLQSFK